MDFQQTEKQMVALGQDTYELARMKWDEAKNKSMSIGDLLTIEQIRAKRSRIEIEIQNQENWYLRADYRPHVQHDVVFIDDNTPQGAEFLRSQGVIPCCVVQTSTRDDGAASLHCWYRMPAPLDVQTRKAVERVLLNRLHAEFPHPDPTQRPGDNRSADGCHRGRLAGTWNFGLGKERDCPVVLLEATGHILSEYVAAELLEAAAPYIDYSPKRKPSQNLLEIQEHKYENPKIVRWFTENVVSKMDSTRPHYQQDLFAVAKLLRAKFSDIDIKKVLLENDPNSILDRKRDPAFFLETVLQEIKASLAPKAPSPTPGGGRGTLHLRELASAPPSVPQLIPAPQEPEQEKPFTGLGTISPDGRIEFNTEKPGTLAFHVSEQEPLQPQSLPAKTPAPKTPVLRPRRKSFGVKPRVMPAGPRP